MNKLISSIIIITGCFFISGCSLIDDSSLNLGTPRFASGPTYGSYYPFAEGIIDAASETLGMFMDNVSTAGSLENARNIVSGDKYLGDAYMAMMQEDIFNYARNINIDNYDNDRPVDKTFLKAASQIQVLLALYKEDVHLLVKTGTGINTIADLSGKIVNLGSENSGTYVTASNIMKAYADLGLVYTPKTDDASVGISKVVSGEYDAAFFVTAAPSPVFTEIAADAGVILIPVQMPDSKKSYDESGSILAGDYPFQTVDVGNNITIKTLLVAGPNFDDRNIGIFFDYIFQHAGEYKSFNKKWEDVSLALSQDYMMANPEKCNYRAMCYVSGFPELDPFYVEPLFGSAEGDSSYHEMAIELIWLMSHNMNVDLREKNTTGSWENAYYMLKGDTTMAIVQDDIFPYLVNNKDMYDSMMAASMKKVVPLHYEYVHLLVSTRSFAAPSSNWNQWGGVPYSLDEIFTDPAVLNKSEPKLYINIGPKTSGTFITAMNIINSYKTMDNSTADVPDEPDMDGMEIHYSFDSVSDAVSKVNNGYDSTGTTKGYHAMFAVSGVPYNRFYSHDTYNITTSLATCDLLPVHFYNNALPEPYKNGIIDGGGVDIYEDYPYASGFLAADLTNNIRLRAVQVVSPVFDDSDIETYLKSVFRKGDYMSPPLTEESNPNPMWTAIKKASFISADADYNTYGEDVEGAIEYFIRNPFGWSKNAVKYYLGMIQDN